MKDWYSDNWITDVYGENTHRLKILILNTNDRGTRYAVCSKPKYAEVLETGKRLIADYKSDSMLEKDGNKKNMISRLGLELNHGPIFQ